MTGQTIKVNSKILGQFKKKPSHKKTRLKFIKNHALLSWGVTSEGK